MSSTIIASSCITDVHALDYALSLTQPLGELVVWAEQLGDLEWQERQPEMLQLAAASDRLFQAVARRSFGQTPTSCFWVSRRPRRMEDLERAFEGSRWQLYASYGASTAVDSRMHPPLYFLAVGLLRDQMDPGSGKAGVDAIGRRLGAVPALGHGFRPTNWRPGQTFNRVLQEAQEDLLLGASRG